MKTIVFIARLVIIVIVALVVLRFVAVAQQPQQQPDMTIDAATRTAVIDKLLVELNDSYVFAETAKKMEADIRTRITNKEYDLVTSAKAFAEKLTADLQSVSKDKHLRVRFSSQVIPQRTESSEPSLTERANFERSLKFENFGFEKVERLRGNIGYIELFGFMAPVLGAETVRSSFGFVANSDALIIDLRQNGGGNPGMVALISSYLFGDKPVHLNDLYWRKGDRTDEFWTDPKVAGRKFVDKPVYVLTSNFTFSGAEEFAYNLKNLKRAVIVGETTGGGAHPGGSVRLGDHFRAFIPGGRAINPISKTNWEGTGVEPDVKVPKEIALQTAQLLGLKKLLESEKDDERRELLNRLIERVQGEMNRIKPAAK